MVLRLRVWVIVLLTLLYGLVLAAPSFAQDGYRVSAVSVGSGENPITSGLSATVQLKDAAKKCSFTEITVQERQAWFMQGCDLRFGRVRSSLYWSVGHQQGALWVGPYASVTVPLAKIGNQEIAIGVLTWPGFFTREPADFRTETDGVQNPEAILGGYFSLGYINMGPVSLTVTYLNFMDKPTEYLYGFEYTKKLTDTFKAKTGVTWYDARKKEKERFMYFIGATWEPAK